MNTNAPTDRELVLRILSGHPDLFAPLIERHLRAAHAVTYARLGNAADAEDAVQEAFLRAYERLASLRDPARFAPWLLTIARHEASRIAAKRDRVNAPDISNMDDISSTKTIQPDPAQRELNALLRDHVMRLPESAREVLLLHYFAGHSARDIAELLDLRRAAVLKRLQRAREALAEAMLCDLETARPTSETVTRHTARIASLALALGIKHALPTTAIAAAAVSTTVLWKSLAAGVLVVGAVSIAILTRAVLQSDAPVPPAPESVSTPTSVLPAPPSVLGEQPVTGPQDPAPSFSPAAAPLATIATDSAAVDSEEDLWPLDGAWSVTGLPEWFDREVTIIDLKSNGRSIAVAGKSGEHVFKGDGTLIGSLLRLTLRIDLANRRTAEPTLTLEGALGARTDMFTLSGVLADAGIAMLTSNNGPVPVTLGPMALRTTWKRLEPHSLDFRTFVAQKIRELEQLHVAIEKYQETNGMLPVDLRDLVPGFLESLDPFALANGADVEYDSTVYSTLKYTEDDIQPRNVFRGEYRPDLPMPDRLAAYERDLQEFWTDPFPRPAIVTVTYAAHPVRMYLMQEGGVATTLLPQASRSLQEHLRFLGEQRATCTNNLKQLGLAFKMFMDECPGNYSPPGWLSTHPEYVPDRNLFTCPNHERGGFSYRLTWPTASVAELRQFYLDRFGDIGRVPDSLIPIIVETHECSLSGGRNVLFLDGHVEYLVGLLEQRPEIAPFLNLR